MTRDFQIITPGNQVCVHLISLLHCCSIIVHAVGSCAAPQSCGSSGSGSCFCDDACFGFSDCCYDVNDFCPCTSLTRHPQVNYSIIIFFYLTVFNNTPTGLPPNVQASGNIPSVDIKSDSAQTKYLFISTQKMISLLQMKQ